MKIIEEILPDCFVIEPNVFKDARGSFIKTFNDEAFSKLNISFEMKEEFYSISKKNVVRGMHFQIPPFDHDKIVFCMNGCVHDVLLDLRKGPNYGKFVGLDLSDKNNKIVVIPRGIAHGFVSRTDDSVMLYKTSTVHSPEYDRGIHWNSFEYDWNLEGSIVSKRDSAHIDFENFESPF